MEVSCCELVLFCFTHDGLPRLVTSVKVKEWQHTGADLNRTDGKGHSCIFSLAQFECQPTNIILMLSQTHGDQSRHLGFPAVNQPPLNNIITSVIIGFTVIYPYSIPHELLISTSKDTQLRTLSSGGIKAN